MTIFLLFLINLVSPSVSSQFYYPSDFIWGTASASYQIEGAYQAHDRSYSIWDTFSHEGKCFENATGDIADDHYNRVEQDIDLIKNLSLGWYRMSFSWSRIFSDGGTYNKAGVLHYQDELKMLQKAGIQPFVTLYHWDLPQYLQTTGGWLNNNIVDAYVTYADTCFKEFGEYVKFWLTFNEPYCTAWLGNGVGIHAPGRCTDRIRCSEGNSSTEPYLVGHNILRAHAKAVDLYRKKYQSEQNGKIGISLNSDWAEPYLNEEADIQAAERYLEFMLGWFADPIFLGDYPESMRQLCRDLPAFTEEEKTLLHGSYDFFGLNHYTSLYASNSTLNPNPPVTYGWEKDLGVYVSRKNKDGVLIGLPADSDWLYVVPWGFRKLLIWIKDRYANPDLYVTENGVSVPGESTMSLQMALNDTFRVNYYRDYIAQMEVAMTNEVNVKGYFAWTLMDNFEWADGYSKRFGLYYVNFSTQERTMKSSGKYYSTYIQSLRPPNKEIKWWYLSFFVIPGLVLLVVVGICNVYENKKKEYSSLSAENVE